MSYLVYIITLWPVMIQVMSSLEQWVDVVSLFFQFSLCWTLSIDSYCECDTVWEDILQINISFPELLPNIFSMWKYCSHMHVVQMIILNWVQSCMHLGLVFSVVQRKLSLATTSCFLGQCSIVHNWLLYKGHMDCLILRHR